MDETAGRPMTQEQALDFLRWMISETATRPPVRGCRSSFPLIGKHICRTIQPGSFRVSDLAERVCVCFVALTEAGYSSTNAANELQSELGDRIGQSRRGRPRINSELRDTPDRIRNVQAMVSAFAKRVRSQHGAADLERRVNHSIQTFLWLSRERIVIGSEYAPDAARRAMLAHQRQLSRFFRRPIWRELAVAPVAPSGFLSTHRAAMLAALATVHKRP
jgi:hypothetical protein